MTFSELPNDFIGILIILQGILMKFLGSEFKLCDNKIHATVTSLETFSKTFDIQTNFAMVS